MTAAAYAYADSGGKSQEIRLLRYIDRFGVKAVMGRDTLTAREIRWMLHAEAISKAYFARSRQDAAEWVKENPEMNVALREAQLLAEELENDE